MDLTLVAGSATLNGTPLPVGATRSLPPRGHEASAMLVFTSETCTLKVCPVSGRSAGASRLGGSVRKVQQKDGLR